MLFVEGVWVPFVFNKERRVCRRGGAVHKLASSQAEARVEKRIKVGPGFCLDLLCRIVLVALV